MAQGDNNNSMYLLITLAVVIGIMCGLWYFFQAPILEMLRWLRFGELHLVSWFTDRFDGALKVLPQWTIKPRGAPLQPQQLDAATLWNISASLGDFMRWPVAVALAGCLAWIWFKAPTAKFKHKYDLEGLMRIQAQSWPAISPVVNFDPAKLSARVPGAPVPAELPAFAESLAPDEWVSWARIPMHEGEPDKEGIRQAFTAQLGPRWEGLTGLKPHHRALMAAFILKGMQKRKDSDDLLGLIAQCWTVQKGLVLTEAVQGKVEAVLKNDDWMATAMEIAGAHAYRTTALLGLLRWAREQGGVLAPAQFLWLRGQDRALWYPLNNLGRRSFHAEAAGAMAHYMAERAADNNRGRALPMPRVDTAIQPVMDYVQGVGGRVPLLTLKDSKSKPVAAAKNVARA